MISSSHLNKLFYIILFYSLLLNFNISIAAVDIWEKDNKKKQESNEVGGDKDIKIESPIISDDVNKIIIKIDENEIKNNEESVIGIFDPEENNFNLNMWTKTDGEDIKKTLKSKSSEALDNFNLFILFKIFLISSPSDWAHIFRLKLFSSGSNIPIIDFSESSISPSSIFIIILFISSESIGLSIFISCSSLILFF